MAIEQSEILQEQITEVPVIPASPVLGEMVEVVPCVEPETEEARAKREAQEARIAQEARVAADQFYAQGVSDYCRGLRDTPAAKSYISSASKHGS